MKSFAISKKQLDCLVETGAISSQEWQKELKSLGGKEYLINSLQTSLETGLKGDQDDRLRRAHYFGQISSNKNHITSSLKSIIKSSLISGKQIIFYYILTIQALYAFYSSKEHLYYQTIALVLVLSFYALLKFCAEIFTLRNGKYQLEGISCDNTANVLRNGTEQKIAQVELLIGDIVSLKQGDKLFTNCLLIEGDVKLGKNEFNGNDLSTKLLKNGDFIVKGQGKALVLSLPTKLQNQSKSQKLIDQRQRQSPLYWFGIASSFVIGLLILHEFRMNHPNKNLKNLQVWIQIACSAILIKGLTSYSVNQELRLNYTYICSKIKENHLVLHSQNSCRQLGSIQDLILPKKGIFTKRFTKVSKFFVQSKNLTPQSHDLCPQTLQLISLSISNNISLQGSPNQNEQKLDIEAAMIQFIRNLGYDYNWLRKPQKHLKIFPFENNRKMMATVFSDDNGSVFVFIKGAPQLLLPMSNSYVGPSGQKYQLDNQYLDTLNEVVEQYGSESLVPVLIAYKQFVGIPQDWSDIQHSLTILSIIGIQSHLSKDIEESIENLTAADITIRMATGDNKRTAISTARNVGLLDNNWVQTDSDCTVMGGHQLREFIGNKYNNQASGHLQNLQKIAKQLRILFRSSQDDRILLINVLKKLGRKVGVLTDSPSISSKSDIIIHQQQKVYDKQKSLLLKNGGLRSIRQAIRWSRSLPSASRKIIRFQVSLILVTINLYLLSSFYFGRSPISVTQLAWIHLILAFFVSLVFAVRTPLPAAKRDSINDEKGQWMFVLRQTFSESLKLGYLIIFGPEKLGILPCLGLMQSGRQGKHEAIIFNTFVMIEIFTSLGASISWNSYFFSPATLFRNRPLYILIFTAITLQLLILKLEAYLLGTADLTFKENALCILFGIGSLFPCAIASVLSRFMPIKH